MPFWTIPIALVAGNCVILKPSEKVPLTMQRAAELLFEAGVPAGAFQMVQGEADVVGALCDHAGIAALTFVGSSRVAELVHNRARAAGKKVLALGGAKNHLVAAPDRDVPMASADIVASFAGCAGQRCMAASVLITIGEQPELIDAVVAKAAQLRKGQHGGCVGPVIDCSSRDKIVAMIDAAVAGGAQLLLDGRSWVADGAGWWVGPTVLKLPESMREHEVVRTEIFGPVLCVLAARDARQALEWESLDKHGNAACIYTQSGATADYFARRFSAAMIGVNIGVPVPREPFSFGGMEGSLSKFGEHDITAEGGMHFFTKVRARLCSCAACTPCARSGASASSREGRAPSCNCALSAPCRTARIRARAGPSPLYPHTPSFPRSYAYIPARFYRPALTVPPLSCRSRAGAQGDDQMDHHARRATRCGQLWWGDVKWFLALTRKQNTSLIACSSACGQRNCQPQQRVERGDKGALKALVGEARGRPARGALQIGERLAPRLPGELEQLVHCLCILVRAARQPAARHAVHGQHNVCQRPAGCVRDGHDARGHELDDANAKVLHPHRVQSHRRAPQPAEPLRVAHVRQDLHAVREAELSGEGAQIGYASRVGLASTRANHDQLRVRVLGRPALAQPCERAQLQRVRLFWPARERHSVRTMGGAGRCAPAANGAHAARAARHVQTVAART